MSIKSSPLGQQTSVKIQQPTHLVLDNSNTQNANNNINKLKNHAKYRTSKLDEPYWIKYRSFTRISAILIFINIAMVVGVITVSLTSPKHTNQTCQLNFKRSAKRFNGYDSFSHDINTGDFNEDGYLDIVVANYGTDYVEILLQTC